MEEKARFKIIYSDETIRFLNSLDEKAEEIRKQYFNSKK